MVDKSYWSFSMAVNENYSVEKIMFVCKIPKIQCIQKDDVIKPYFFLGCIS